VRSVSDRLSDVPPARTFAPSPRSPLEKPVILPAVDVLRGITILWVTLFHLYVDTRGIPRAEATAGACLSALQSGQVARAFASAANALAGSPSFRVDLFLFVTGLVLMLSPRSTASAFLSRRMRAVLPSYWLGSLLVLAVIAVLAGIRVAIVGSGFVAEMQRGSILAGTRYLLEPLDIVRSFSIVGRFQNQRTIQVVAPSMWYVVLVLQAYCMFPMLRAFLARLGSVRFFLVMIAITCFGRWLVFRYAFFPSFDPNATVIYFIPFRLLPLAAGMVASGWAVAFRVMPRRSVALGLAAPAMAVVLAALWASGDVNAPGTVLGVIGPIALLLPALPGLWILAAAASAVPSLRRVLVWTGRHSISILVVQDPLRFAVGTVLALGLKLAAWTWWLAPAYLTASLLLAWAWSPVPAWITERVWPLAPAGPRPAGRDNIGE
jgi:peptidoglycan/LPS O-acetylase OafA/YrhL